jgi:amidohydrolase
MIQKLDLLKTRKELHQIAEVSGEEKNTSEYILTILKGFPFTEIKTQIGGNGILAILEGKKESPSTLFRAELDALPIAEINTFEYKSITPNVSHKCGHDGHMTILLGLIEEIFKNKTTTGTTYFLFQPAEENGEGAKAVLNDLNKYSIKPDYVFALHNIPGFTSNEVFCKANEITPAVVSIKVSFKGKTAHAAEPENGINPSLSISDFITFCDDLQVNNKNSDDFLVLTPIHINMGEIAYGISAGEGEVHYTIRCWNNIKIKETKNKIESFLTKLSIDRNISISFNYLEEFHSNQNNAECVEFIRKACENNNIKYNSMKSPFKWGEDFGIFTDKFKGALFGLGAGEETPSLHNPDYDFPDYLTENGIQIFKTIWETIQKNNL